MNRPRLLDLFSGAGGSAVGYHRAGFDVIGVDNQPQPRYPFTFYQRDAFAFLDKNSQHFDAIHASPPCHDHSPLAALVGEHGTGWMLAETRDRLEATRLPYVIENVPGAAMRAPVTLCGKMFGLRVKRHRQFEISGLPLIVLPAHPRHRVLTATRSRRERWEAGWDVSITGDVGTYLGADAMGIDWMTGNELSQAIPPAYTEYIGRQLLDHLAAERAS